MAQIALFHSVLEVRPGILDAPTRLPQLLMAALDGTSTPCGGFCSMSQGHPR
ncbi:hypothetical protein [Luethyella okanaganae]|uniref:Uncharacterized protein n=1 Tax=Luethyella okanaganae TaxID=69372 RepID=A0ABW1VGT3_9MICO